MHQPVPPPLPPRDNAEVPPYGKQSPMQKRETRRFWGKIGLEVLALLGLAVYTTINAIQLGDSEATDRRTTETQVVSAMPLILPSNLVVTVHRGFTGEPVVRFHQEWMNLGEARAEGPVISWRVGLDPSADGSPYWHRNDEWASTTWIKGAPASDEIEIPKRAFRHAGRRAAPIYVTGRIRFSDVFPSNSRRHDHLVEYCIAVSRLFDAHETGYVHPCSQGNCYDQDCKADYK